MRAKRGRKEPASGTVSVEAMAGPLIPIKQNKEPLPGSLYMAHPMGCSGWELNIRSNHLKALIICVLTDQRRDHLSQSRRTARSIS